MQEKITLSWLARRGYTLREAAKVLGKTPGHLSRAISGERVMCHRLEEELRALPQGAPKSRRLTVVHFA